MAQDGTLKLSRVQLARIADNDPEVIKQLENLFLQAANTNPADIDALQAQVDNLGLVELAPVLQMLVSVLAGANITVSRTGDSFTVALSGSVVTASVTSALTNTTGKLIDSNVGLTNGAAAALGTLANAPTAGNPTKWIPINDNGTTRYV